MNGSHQLIIDQLFEHEAHPIKQLFSQQSSGPLYPPSCFQVSFWPFTGLMVDHSVDTKQNYDFLFCIGHIVILFLMPCLLTCWKDTSTFCSPDLDFYDFIVN